uniref:Uncharacterized protein n=1 Tax=Cacopsylla melanoneura TaxID=428564 RepID=A0A8D8QR41_9HEMI
MCGQGGEFGITLNKSFHHYLAIRRPHIFLLEAVTGLLQNIQPGFREGFCHTDVIPLQLPLVHEDRTFVLVRHELDNHWSGADGILATRSQTVSPLDPAGGNINFQLILEDLAGCFHALLLGSGLIFRDSVHQQARSSAVSLESVQVLALSRQLGPDRFQFLHDLRLEESE